MVMHDVSRCGLAGLCRLQLHSYSSECGMHRGPLLSISTDKKNLHKEILQVIQVTSSSKPGPSTVNSQDGWLPEAVSMVMLWRSCRSGGFCLTSVSASWDLAAMRGPGAVLHSLCKM